MDRHHTTIFCCISLAFGPPTVPKPPNPPIPYLLKSSLLASKQWVVLSYPFVPLFFLPSNFRSLLSPCLIALLVLGMYKIRIDVVFFFFFLRAFGNHIIRLRGKVRKGDESYDVGIPYDRRGPACQVTLGNDGHDTHGGSSLITVAAVVAVVLYFFYCAPQLRCCWGVHTTSNY